MTTYKTHRTAAGRLVIRGPHNHVATAITIRAEELPEGTVIEVKKPGEEESAVRLVETAKDE
jgi:hypothetical protein